MAKRKRKKKSAEDTLFPYEEWVRLVQEQWAHSLRVQRLIEENKRTWIDGLGIPREEVVTHTTPHGGV